MNSTASMDLPRIYYANISPVLEGLSEKIEHEDRIINIFKVVFSLTLLATSAAVNFTAVPFALIGSGILLAAVCTTYLIAYNNSLLASQKWESILNSIFSLSVELGAEYLRNTVHKNWKQNLQNKTEMVLFEKNALEGLVFVDVTRKHFGGEEYFLPLFVRMLLLADLKIIQIGKDASFEATFRNDLNMIQAFAHVQRLGPTEEQEAIFQLSERSWEEIKEDVKTIHLPIEVSVGYGMMVDLIYHLKRFEPTSELFDEKGNITDAGEYGSLKEWKITTERARLWLIKEKKYNGEIASFIENIQKSKTEKEWCEMAQSFNGETFQEFLNQREEFFPSLD
jgi:hypothetical protein